MFEKDGIYYSADTTSHNGGVWKGRLDRGSCLKGHSIRHLRRELELDGAVVEMIVRESGLWLPGFTREAAVVARSVGVEAGLTVRLLDPARYWAVGLDYATTVDLVCAISADWSPLVGETEEEIDRIRQFVAAAAGWWLGTGFDRARLDEGMQIWDESLDLSPWAGTGDAKDLGVSGWNLDWGAISADQSFRVGRELLARGITRTAEVRTRSVQVILDRAGAVVLARRLRRNHEALLSRYSGVRYRQTIEEGIDEWFVRVIGQQPGAHDLRQ